VSNSIRGCPTTSRVRLAASAILVAAVAAALPVSAHAASGLGETEGGGPRVAIAFVPGPPPEAKPLMITRLASIDELAIGFTSSILGSYRPEQTLLDISAGARTWTSLYEGELPERIELTSSGSGGAITGWAAIRRRAETPPADVVPGSLAQAVGGAGGTVAYVGLERRRNREAIVAAGRDGRIATVSLEPRARLARELARRWRAATLLVARLPAGRDGSRALAELLRARRPADLVLVLQQPTGAGRRLLAIGIAGLEGGKNLRSDSTRTDGLVVTTDIAPTVLEQLRVPVPDEMGGSAIEARGQRSAQQLSELKDRLDEVGPRRWSISLGGLGGAVLLAAVWAGARGGGPRRVARTGFLAALWLPSILLVTGALAPSRVGELLLVAASGWLLGSATDRLVRWPNAIAVPAAVSVLFQVVDLALGSAWTQRSLLGPNPILGARFYGVGNELEATLAVVGLLGLGAALATARPRALMWGFVLGGGGLAFALSWGRLGADVGASIMLAAGAAAAAVVALGQRPGRQRVAIVLAAPAAALAVLALLDIATGGDAHFTRSVLRAGGLSELADIAQRRFELSYYSLRRGIIWLLVAVAVIALVWGVRSRHRLLSPLARMPGLRAGLYGALVAVVVGAVSNDSGPIILLIGASYLALAAGYVSAHGESGKRPARPPE
jgi:hypothetical protein